MQKHLIQEHKFKFATSQLFTFKMVNFNNYSYRYYVALFYMGKTRMFSTVFNLELIILCDDCPIYSSIDTSNIFTIYN